MTGGIKERIVDRLTSERKPDLEQFIQKWAPGREFDFAEELGELFQKVLSVVIPETFKQ